MSTVNSDPPSSAINIFNEVTSDVVSKLSRQQVLKLRAATTPAVPMKWKGLKPEDLPKVVVPHTIIKKGRSGTTNRGRKSGKAMVPVASCSPPPTPSQDQHSVDKKNTMATMGSTSSKSASTEKRGKQLTARESLLVKMRKMKNKK